MEGKNIKPYAETLLLIAPSERYEALTEMRSTIGVLGQGCDIMQLSHASETVEGLIPEHTLSVGPEFFPAMCTN